MAPDQTEQSDLDLHCLLKRLQNVTADNKNIRLFVICALRVNTCDGPDFHERPKSLLTLYEIKALRQGRHSRRGQLQGHAQTSLRSYRA